ncbi:MAG: hypothetical protein WC384_05220 [Prolixibacteraceae bacterium]|jgi:glucosamine 6-phosphate synthetase-like amidotransferase/phosphosugar isomerase protein
MNKYLFTSILVLLVAMTFGQTKQKENEKAPSQNEMQDMMKEMQEALDEMSPEDKKAMEEMGIKMPDVNSTLTD